MVQRSGDNRAEKEKDFQSTESVVEERPQAQARELRERIIFLECRCEQLAAANKIANTEITHIREALTTAEKRETASVKQLNSIQSLLDEKIRA